MTDFLVFSSELDANKAEAAIFAFGSQLAEAAGLPVVDGKIRGSAASIFFSSAWYPPTQRATDGKWTVKHPKHHNVAGRPGLLDQCMGGIDALNVTYTVEVLGHDWFAE